MTDYAAFLKAILAAPDDDLPRLILADWLDERGDPRGEFIRVQCRLAELERLDNDGPPWSPPELEVLEEQCVLRRREREFLVMRFHDWIPPELPWGDYVDDDAHGPTIQLDGGRLAITFRRGFVESVACTLGDWLRHGPAIVRATPLREVRLTDRRPARIGDPVIWSWHSILSGIDVPDSLLAQMFVCLRGQHDRHGERRYATEAAALADLSAACVAWAKATGPLIQGEWPEVTGPRCANCGRPSATDRYGWCAHCTADPRQDPTRRPPAPQYEHEPPPPRMVEVGVPVARPGPAFVMSGPGS